MKTQTDKIKRHADTLVSFAEKHSAKATPVCCVHHISPDTTIPEITFYKSDLQKVVQHFGKEGWTRKAGFHRSSYDYVKEVDGVTVKICEVEQIVFGGEVSPDYFANGAKEGMQDEMRKKL